MKLGIVHLSDFHFKNDNNPVEQKSQNFLEAIKPFIVDCEKVIVALAGDVAFSGKKEEYERAITYLKFLISEIETANGKDIIVASAPGNHDCDFLLSGKTREAVIQAIKEKGEVAIDKEAINVCCAVQTEYFNFRETIRKGLVHKYNDKLLSVGEFEVDGRIVRLNSYNSSWLSSKEEKCELYIPANLKKQMAVEDPSSLIISLCHHPVHWYHKSSYRSFREQLTSTSDIILFGHEHISDIQSISNGEENIAHFIDGNVMQSQVEHEHEQSGFNYIEIDTSEMTFRVYPFSYNKNTYQCEVASAVKYIRQRGKYSIPNLFISETFRREISDLGISISHTSQKTISLEDIFVYPNVRDLSSDDTVIDVGKVWKPMSLDTVFESIIGGSSIILTGSDLAGKSAYLKHIFPLLYNKGYCPILIKGEQIKQADIKGIEKVINNNFQKQYSCNSDINLEAIDRSKWIILIDDVDELKIKTQYVIKMLVNMKRIYHGIIVTSNPELSFSILISDANTVKAYSEFYKYEILEYGHSLRSKFINKWLSLSDDLIPFSNEFLRRHDAIKRVMDSFVGTNYVPSVPFYLIIVLQLIEVGTPIDNKQSIFGHYYSYLISTALGEAAFGGQMVGREIEVNSTFLSELADIMIRHELNTINMSMFTEFHSDYLIRHGLTSESKYIYNLENLLSRLCDVGLLRVKFGEYSFKYKYQNYYFTAKYYSDHLSEEEIKERVKKMISQLYYEPYSNIILFMTHHTKNPFIIEEIMKRSSKIFETSSPLHMDDDIRLISQLWDTVPKLAVERVDIIEERNKQLELIDEIEQNEIKDDNEEEEEEIGLHKGYISELNEAFKVMDIIGQILRSYFGSMNVDTTINLCDAGILVGLRTVSDIYGKFTENIDAVVQEVKEWLVNKNFSDKIAEENYAKRVLFYVLSLVSYGIIRKMSLSMGDREMSSTYKGVIARHNWPSVYLFDIAVKIDYGENFPFKEYELFKKNFDKNAIVKRLLQYFAAHYMYYYTTKESEKQKICKIADLTLEQQRVRGLLSDSKKRKPR
ncbi:metallophosphoesterase [bacterium]|nr:metallophosphoesterase [bacterium]